MTARSARDLTKEFGRTVRRQPDPPARDTGPVQPTPPTQDLRPTQPTPPVEDAQPTRRPNRRNPPARVYIAPEMAGRVDDTIVSLAPELGRVVEKTVLINTLLSIGFDHMDEVRRRLGPAG